jgi:phenylacetate-coenzyme A ligase PaaK-like adenylate-forming protein
MNDHLIFDDKKCGCSWPFPVIKTIAGRQEDFLWFQKPDGEKEYLHPLSILAFFVPGLEKFQVEQVEINKFVMRVVLRGNAESVVPAVRARMNEILREKGLEGAVNFDVEVVNELRVDPLTGKFKMIIPFKALSLE